MKKIISMLTAVIMTMSLMTSCTKNNVKVEDSNGNPIEIEYAYENKKLKNGVVAKVGETEITTEEVRFYLALLSASLFQQNGLDGATKEEKDKLLDETYDGKNTYRGLIYEQTIDTLVSMTVFSELGKAKGIDYDDEKLNEAYEENGMLEQKEDLKKQYDVTDEGIDACLKKQLIYSDYAQQYLQKDERMNPGDDVLKKFFNENYLKAKHILKLTVNQETNEPLSEDEKKATKEKAEKILKDVKGGADFDKAVETESEDPGSQSEPDGYVFTEGEMVTEFYEGTKALKEDEISDIIETSYGYHIIKRLALTDEDYTDNADSVKSAYQNDEFKKITDEEKAKVKIYVDYKKLLNINDVFYMTASAAEADTQDENAQQPANKEEEK